MTSNIKMVRGSSSKVGTTYTFAFSTLAIFEEAKKVFEKNNCKSLTKEPIETPNGFEARFLATNQAILRTTLRIIKKSGVSKYRGTAPKYLKTASKDTIKIANSLKKIVVKVEEKIEKVAKEKAPKLIKKNKKK